MYLCITPERLEKTSRIMHALKHGWNGDAEIIVGPPPDDHEPFFVWGQTFLALDVIPKAIRTGRPFFQVDNGFWNSAKGHTTGNYRVSYRGLSPIMLRNAPADRCRNVRMMPWKGDGHSVLLAYPGPMFGRSIGLDMLPWRQTIADRLRRATTKAIIQREKRCERPLANDLARSFALVTHSSNVAVDAVIAGVPVIVEPTSPAAPVGGLCLTDVNDPPRPDRGAWLASLSCQQFTLGEMASGLACDFLTRVVGQVDGIREAA